MGSSAFFRLRDIGMGCSPSANESNGATDTPTNDDDRVENATSDSRRASKSVLETEANAEKNRCRDSDFECKNSNVESNSINGRSSIQGSDKVKACPMAAQDEDGENESASFLCANLRRNFISNRLGSAGSRSNRRTSGIGGKKLATTAEEQNDNFLSSEDGGDSNPLLTRHTNPPGDVVSQNLCQGADLSVQKPHYIQLQQQRYHPFNCGRKLSSNVTEKVILYLLKNLIYLNLFKSMG